MKITVRFDGSIKSDEEYLIWRELSKIIDGKSHKTIVANSAGIHEVKDSKGQILGSITVPEKCDPEFD